MRKVWGVLLLLAIPAVGCAWTISWDRVTLYTDNTVINDDNVVYNLYIDNARVFTGADNSYSFTAPRGQAREYKVNAELARQGTVSDNTTTIWSAPTGKPTTLGPLRFR